MTPLSLYEYRADLMRVVDGDTVVLDIDLGFGVWKRGETFRLYGINAPEMRGASKVEGQAAKTYLMALLMHQLEHTEPLFVRTHKADAQDKYGRYLATLLLPSRLNVNGEMVRAGHAQPYMVEASL